jgi:hypothetical protein
VEAAGRQASYRRAGLNSHTPANTNLPAAPELVNTHAKCAPRSRNEIGVTTSTPKRKVGLPAIPPARIPPVAGGKGRPVVKIVERWNGKLSDSPVIPDEEHPLQLFTYQDVANLCQVTTQTVQEWVKKGMIESPQSFGWTMRFTLGQVRSITQGRQAPGTHEVKPSPRAEIGKKGGNPKGRWKKTKPTKHGKTTARPKPSTSSAKGKLKLLKSAGNVSN